MTSDIKEKEPKWCIQCKECHNRLRKAVWFRKEKNSEVFCDECYDSTLKWLQGYRKKVVKP